VRLLLDTHTFVWWDSGALIKAVASHIRDAEDVFVSAATAWEIAIKSALGKMTVRGSVADAIADYGFSELSISVKHAEAVRTLPPHHRDPFDRLLVAQAGAESLTIVSKDPALKLYGARVIWA
jgi:PIN domain nuclease of toxin-antitoxin system